MSHFTNSAIVWYVIRVKKRFGFSLDEDLHAALQARAEEENTSMAAICREALLLHLQKPALELPLPPRPTTAGPIWDRLKQGVSNFLSGEKPDNTLEELEDFLAAPFKPEHTPDLFYRTESPRRKRGFYHSPPERRAVVENYNTRWLDELWA